MGIMAYAVGDIVEVTWQQLMFSQQVLNVQHYRCVSSTSSGSDVGDNASFANHLASLTGAGQLIDLWAGALAPSWELKSVKVQKISPVRSAYVTASINQMGQAATTTQLSNLAVVVSKRGTSGTRSGQGSIHFAGWPTNFFTGGEVQAGIDTWWNNLEPLWSATQVVATIPASLQPVIFNPGATPNYQTVAVWQLQDTARVMRRRTVRVGV
jgi:hypothetical protein